MNIERINWLNEEQQIQIRNLLHAINWNPRQVEGQIESIKRLLTDINGTVLFALEKEEIVGYVSAQFHSWNRLGQIHGLAIHPEHRNKKTRISFN